MTFKDYFSKQSALYAKARPTYPKEIFDFICALPSEKKMVWDCGTGNGQAAVALADYFEKVFATDPSAEQVKNTQAHPKITYKVESSEHSTLADQSVDLVTVAQALHWFKHEDFFREVTRVLKPGGWVAVWAYSHERKTEAAVGNILTEFAQGKVGKYWAPEIQLIWQKYLTIDFPFREISTPSFALVTHWNLDELMAYILSWSALQNYAKATGEGPGKLVDQLASDLAKVWGDPQQKKKMEWEIYLRVGQRI